MDKKLKILFICSDGHLSKVLVKYFSARIPNNEYIYSGINDFLTKKEDRIAEEFILWADAVIFVSYVEFYFFHTKYPKNKNLLENKLKMTLNEFVLEEQDKLLKFCFRCEKKLKKVI